MKFKADEIASVIQQEIEAFRWPDRRPRSRAGPGSRRRHCARLRPVRRDGRRNGRVPQRRHRAGLQPRRKLRRRHHPRRLPEDRRRGRSQKHRPAAERAGRRRASSAAWSIRWAIRSTARARSSPPSAGPSSSIAPGIAERQPVTRAAADRHQGHRRHDAHRPRPARVDHRRPQDRQDGHRHRRDHQSEGLAA